MNTLQDNRGRNLRYLRLSVTDRCNLRCTYCVSCERQRFIPHSRILRYEEFYRLAAIFHSLGIQKARITGGEPFSRKGIIDFLTGLRSRFPALKLALTTNATLIEPYLARLAEIGLSSINVSLDSFDRATFKSITGSDSLNLVLANIDKMLSLGLTVKINAVAMAGITDAQIGDFIYAARAMPVDIRFIEFMPMGGNTLWDQANFISWQSLAKQISQLVRLEEIPPQADGLAGPARMSKFSGAKGRIGFISAVSDHFCASCNRLRITSEGGLRPCLFSDKEISLAKLLRNPKIRDAQITKAILSGIAKKPSGADILTARSKTAVAKRQMVAIGG